MSNTQKCSECLYVLASHLFPLFYNAYSKTVGHKTYEKIKQLKKMIFIFTLCQAVL